MATYKIKDPDTGKSISLTGDSPPTEQELIDIFAQVHGSNPNGDQSAQSDQSQKGMLQKAWDVLGTAEPMAGATLDVIASQIPGREPTGNKFLDVVGNIPRVGAETLAQTIPPNYSRTALGLSVGSAALEGVSPALKVLRQGIGNQADSVTGAAKGAMNAAWEDASLIFSKGKKAATPLYEAAKAEMKGASLFEGMTDAKEVVNTAKDYLAKGGVLEPVEALTYRKALDVLGRSPRVMKDALIPMRQAADAMAKASPNIAEADPLYQRGLQAESLRNLMPQNKYGGASAFKMGIMAALQHLGLAGKLAGAVVSPAVSGSVATLGGIASRIARNPAAVLTARQALITQFVDRKIHEENQ